MLEWGFLYILILSIILAQYRGLVNLTFSLTSTSLLSQMLTICDYYMFQLLLKFRKKNKKIKKIKKLNNNIITNISTLYTLCVLQKLKSSKKKKFNIIYFLLI